MSRYILVAVVLAILGYTVYVVQGLRQPADGPGWRLLEGPIEESLDPVDTTEVLESEAALKEALRRLGVSSTVPEVDFEHEIVAIVETGASSGAPGCGHVILEGVVGATDPLPTFDTPLPGWYSSVISCNDDYLPRTFVVAIEKS